MKPEIKTVFIFLLFVTFFSAGQGAVAAQPPDRATVGIDEKLGQHVPLDIMFSDEKGNVHALRDLIDRPTIVLPVYYRCTNICTILLGSLADVLDKMQSQPGRDYKALSISFNEDDTPETAMEKKRNYMASLKNPFPEESWKFLTGDIRNITRFTQAVGFNFKRQGEHFLHPAALIIISPEGKIVRYLYGNTFLPFELRMALIEASEGRVGATIGKVLKFCFSYDPKGRRYVVNILRISATVILSLAAIFVTYLIITGRAGKRKTG